jgi:M6 family metalloprotease-like protein
MRLYKHFSFVLIAVLIGLSSCSPLFDSSSPGSSSQFQMPNTGPFTNDPTVIENQEQDSIATHRSGQITTFNQPDGTTIEVKLFGDASFMRAESADGYTLVFNAETGWINYAMLSPDGTSLVDSGIPYTVATQDAVLLQKRIIPGLTIGPLQQDNIRSRVQQQLGTRNALTPPYSTGPSSRALSGSLSQVIILVDFPDRRANIGLNEVESAFNAATYGDSRGSIKSWTTTISNGMVTVSTAVVGYYTAKNDTSFYKRGTTHDYSGTSSLMAEVMPWADARFNFASVSNSNGVVRSFIILYAGDIIANGWANSLWPHASGYNYQTADGVRTGSYYLSNLGNRVPLGLGTSRHEMGHNLFGWPDTYDYDGDSHSAGGFAMETDIPCAPFRAQNGWITVVPINDRNQIYNLPDNANTALKYTNPNNSNEYFMIEYVRKTGWRSNAPDEGLLVWHVDEKGDNNWQDMTPTRHYRHSVEQADGLFQLEKNLRSGSDGDLFHAGYKINFDTSTIPSSNWWNGSPSGLKLSNIGALGGSSISVSVGNPVSTYALTVNNGSGSGNYAPGINLTITALTPAPGQIFDKWIVNSGNVNLWNPVAASTGFSMPAAAVNITASYKTPGTGGTNIAMGKTASQSSDYSSNAIASKANDGTTNGNFNANSVSHTNYDSQAWWAVNLGAKFDIQRVSIWNRTDGVSERLSNFRVEYLDASGNIISNQNYPGTAGTLVEFTNVVSNVQSVRIKLNGTNFLHLAEVQVFGTPSRNAPTIYADPNYTGSFASFDVGDYTLSQMISGGFGNDIASSIRVPAGYTVTLFEHDNFIGASRVVSADTSFLDGFNDLGSSMIVTKIEGSTVNKALGKPVTADSFLSVEPASKAVDGTTSGNSKWCAVTNTDHWLAIDLGKTFSISSLAVKHAGAGGENAAYNTRAFKLQGSLNGSTWFDLVSVSDNTSSSTKHPINLRNMRHVRLYITAGTQGSSKTARIYEVEVY